MPGSKCKGIYNMIDAYDTDVLKVLKVLKDNKTFLTRYSNNLRA